MQRTSTITSLTRGLRRRLSPWLGALALLPLLFAPLASAQTPPREVQVTKSYIIDFEFDWARDGVYCASCNQGAGNSRVAYIDLANQLWVGQVDFQTGKFVPADGRGVLVDTNAALPTDYGNGPEWVFSQQGSQLVYTKFQPDLPHSPDTTGVAMATQTAAGTWVAGFIDNGMKRQSPLGTQDLADAVPRLQYQDINKVRTLWRMADDASTELVVPLRGYNGGSRRWVAGSHKIILTGAGVRGTPSFGFRQVYLYDTDTGAMEQLTNEAADHAGAMMWQAPEYGGEWVFFSVRNTTELIIHRKLPDGGGQLRWTPIGSLSLPAATPYFWSPEYMVFNGKSYVFFQMNVTSDNSDLLHPNAIGMTGILPETLALVQLTPLDSPARLRMDPEYFITAQGPFIYYNRYKLGSDTHQGAVPEGVWRVDTGLGAPTGHNFRSGR